MRKQTYTHKEIIIHSITYKDAIGMCSSEVSYTLCRKCFGFINERLILKNVPKPPWKERESAFYDAVNKGKLVHARGLYIRRSVEDYSLLSCGVCGPNKRHNDRTLGFTHYKNSMLADISSQLEKFNMEKELRKYLSNEEVFALINNSTVSMDHSKAKFK